MSTFHFLPFFFFFLTLARSSHPSCSIYSLSCEWMGLSVNGGCEVTPLAGEHRLAPGRSSCLAVLWLTDCSLGTGTSSHTAGPDSVLDTGHSINLHHHQPHSHFDSAAAPGADLLTCVPTLDQWSGAQLDNIPLFHFYSRGETQTHIQTVQQFSLNAELNTELYISLI